MQEAHEVIHGDRSRERAIAAGSAALSVRGASGAATTTGGADMGGRSRRTPAATPPSARIRAAAHAIGRVGRRVSCERAAGHTAERSIAARSEPALSVEAWLAAATSETPRSAAGVRRSRVLAVAVTASAPLRPDRAPSAGSSEALAPAGSSRSRRSASSSCRVVLAAAASARSIRVRGKMTVSLCDAAASSSGAGGARSRDRRARVIEAVAAAPLRSRLSGMKTPLSPAVPVVPVWATAAIASSAAARISSQAMALDEPCARASEPAERTGRSPPVGAFAGLAFASGLSSRTASRAVSPRASDGGGSARKASRRGGRVFGRIVGDGAWRTVGSIRMLAEEVAGSIGRASTTSSTPLASQGPNWIAAIALASARVVGQRSSGSLASARATIAATASGIGPAAPVVSSGAGSSK